MRPRASLEELRERDVLIEGDGLTLHVDVLARVLTEELHIALRENKLAPSLGTWTMRTISRGYSRMSEISIYAPFARKATVGNGGSAACVRNLIKKDRHTYTVD